MFTIGQFSRLTHLTSKALRHYEKIGLLKPAIVQAGNQYRYYSSTQMDLAERIVLLKDLGVPLAQIREMVALEANNEAFDEQLENHRQRLLAEMVNCNRRLLKLAWWRNERGVCKVNEKESYHVYIHDIPEILVCAERSIMDNYTVQLPARLNAMLEQIQARGSYVAGPPIILYYDTSFNPSQVDLECCWPVADPALANRSLPAIRTAKLVYIGPYEAMEKAYAAIYSWINENGYQALAPMREVSVSDPAVTPPDQLITEICVPIAEIQAEASQ